MDIQALCGSFFDALDGQNCESDIGRRIEKFILIFCFGILFWNASWKTVRS